MAPSIYQRYSNDLFEAANIILTAAAAGAPPNMFT